MYGSTKSFFKKDKNLKFIVFHIYHHLLKVRNSLCLQWSKYILITDGHFKNTIIENGYIFKWRFSQHIHNISFVSRNHPIKRFNLFYDLSIALNNNYFSSFEMWIRDIRTKTSVKGYVKEIYRKTDLICCQ